MSRAGCRLGSSVARPARLGHTRGRLGIVAAAALAWVAHSPAWADDQHQSPPSPISEERVEQFGRLVRDRAQKLLEQHRPIRRLALTGSTGLVQGYETNVFLDGSRRGDVFTQETLNLSLLSRLTNWLRGRITYDLFNIHYAELRDANIVVNTVLGLVQLLPHPRASVDVSYEYGLVNFPFDTSNSFFDHRLKVAGMLAQTSWLVHRTSWTYQAREYDTRLANDAEANPVAGLVREDQRHSLSHELRLNAGRVSATLQGEFYRNLSNEQFQDFYDWDAYLARAVLTTSLSERWTTITSAGYERRDYPERLVPNLEKTERDDLYTLAASIIYRLSKRFQWRYSLIYRYQDSNDPRQDFTDWINETELSIRF